MADGVRLRMIVEDKRLRAITPRMAIELRIVVEDTLIEGISRIKVGMTEPKSGRMSRVSKSGKLHQASAPGEMPAVDVGSLINSLDYEVDLLRPHGELKVGAESAIHLEFGAPRAGIEARPFIAPTWDALHPYFQLKVKLALDRAAGGIT